MSQYQRLLLIINPLLRRSPAINHAGALARASGATLHIVALVKTLDILWLLDEGSRKQVRESYLQNQRDWLKSQAEKLSGRGVAVTCEVAWADDIKQEISDHVTELNPDLLIKEVQHESLLKRAFFTPLDWYLLRQCQVPVYLLGGAAHALPRKVVAAVDVSTNGLENNRLNERIIQQATALAIQCDAELHLLYAYDVSQEYLAELGDGLKIAELTKGLRREFEKTYLDWASQHGVPADRRHFVVGHPVAALSEFTDEHQVDVIVMGRVQFHGLDKLLGSTTEHILYQVPCNVLAV
ncbi:MULTISPECIES: universal stress protein [Pseudomonas]|uniref:universal stress protein n=1 Tax=Pseudomonas TaxID=286 RepID=UPI000A1ECB58|nr:MULTISPECIES: universal stress protein [Pseudomonas]MCX4216626.1 universal stress protein [Pseudomonas sp. MCal1]MDI2143656.1 universal stress protein [Pseudomonas sp. ITA]UIN53887.1 universal stress protein [Pseudomonas kribbensis]